MSSQIKAALDVIQGSHQYNQWICSILNPHLSGVVLDIGSGLGNIASLFVGSHIQEVILSESDQDTFVELVKEPFSLKKFRTLILDISQKDAVKFFNGDRINTITCVNVLEHIKDDIGALKNMREILKLRGKVVIFVPALMGIYGTLDTAQGHFRRYTHKTLRERMQLAGFEVMTWRYMNIFGILTWFIAGKVLRQKTFSKKTCGCLDKAVPLLRRMEESLRLPFGQSLLMAGRKV